MSKINLSSSVFASRPFFALQGVCVVSIVINGKLLQEVCAVFSTASSGFYESHYSSKLYVKWVWLNPGAKDPVLSQ